MKRITVPEEGIETLFGSYDENLKHLESLFNVRIRTHGHDLLVEGNSPDLDRVEQLFSVAPCLCGHVTTCRASSGCAVREAAADRRARGRQP